MKDNKSGWQFPKALEIIKCKEGNKEFMKERPARRPFGNTVLICEYPIDDTAAEEPNAKLITWRLGSGRSRAAAGVREGTRLDAMRRRLPAADY